MLSFIFWWWMKINPLNLNEFIFNHHIALGIWNEMISSLVAAKHDAGPA